MTASLNVVVRPPLSSQSINRRCAIATNQTFCNIFCDGLSISFQRIAPTATAGCFREQSVLRTATRPRFWSAAPHRPVGRFDEAMRTTSAKFGVDTPGGEVRRSAPMLRVVRSAKHRSSQHAAAAAEFPRAFRIGDQAIANDLEWVISFDHFDGRVARIR